MTGMTTQKELLKAQDRYRNSTATEEVSTAQMYILPSEGHLLP